MKNLKYVLLLIGFILFNLNAGAQYYTSFGYSQDWHLPKHVHHTIYDNYYGFEIAHVYRYHGYGHQHFDIILHKKGYLLELMTDNNGRINKRIEHRYFNPLLTHSCTNHCGYHNTHHQKHYPNYHKIHYGYKTIVYVKSTKAHHHNNNQYYTKVYVDQKSDKQNHYHINDLRQTTEGKKSSFIG